MLSPSRLAPVAALALLVAACGGQPSVVPSPVASAWLLARPFAHWPFGPSRSPSFSCQRKQRIS